MPHFGVVTDYDDAGYPQVAAFTANYAYGALPATVKAGPGRLCMVTVSIATVGGAITFYDNASAASGVPLLTIPASTPAGTTYPISLPAFSGIYVSQSGVTAGAITVGWS